MNYNIEIHFLDGSAEVFMFSTKEEANSKISNALRQGHFSLTQGLPGQQGREFYIPISAVKKAILTISAAK